MRACPVQGQGRTMQAQMVRFSIFGVSVSISPSLWLTLAVLGGALSCTGMADCLGVSLFVVAGFVSLLAHEMGHALVGRWFAGNHPEVHLAWLGGDCNHEGASFTRMQGVVMTLAGPLASVLMGCVGMLLLILYVGDWQYGLYLTRYFIFNVIPADALGLYPNMALVFFCNLIAVSCWWTLLNMLPVFPLDGGQIMHGLMRSPKMMHAVSLYVAVALVFLFSSMGLWVMGMFMLALAILNHRFRSNAPY